MDVMMPQRDGFDVLRVLRADPELQTLPVILLSARAGEEARVEGLAAGADAYLVKPFSARELLAQVEAPIKLGRLRAHVAHDGWDEAPATAPSCTILLVDDEPGIVKGLTQLLHRDGHTIDTAANGRLALAHLQGRSYDLILCDLRMPELDGPGLYRALEQHASPLCQRFIFLAGDTLSPEVATFFAQSGVPRLTKPFTAAEVRRAIALAYRGSPSSPGTRTQ